MVPNQRSVSPDRLVHQILSPGFSTSIPKAVHFELVSGDLQAAMHALWGAEWQESPINFYSLRDVFVVGEGLVFDRDLNVIDLSVTQNSPEVVGHGLQMLQNAIATRSLRECSGTALLCGKAGLNNYGHWLAEMLPLLHMSRPWINQPNGWKVLVPKVYDVMRGIITESLDLADIPVGQRIVGDGHPFLVDELVFVHGLTKHGQFFSPLVVAALDEITATVPAGSDKSVWITRDGDPRSLIDEAEANKRLAGLGWKILSPGSMSLLDQIKAARGASHMAGVNGAGLANLLFMRPGGRLSSFVPAVMPDIFYWQLCGHRGLLYEEVRSRQLPDFAGPVPWNAQLTLPHDEVIDFLMSCPA